MSTTTPLRIYCLPRRHPEPRGLDFRDINHRRASEASLQATAQRNKAQHFYIIIREYLYSKIERQDHTDRHHGQQRRLPHPARRARRHPPRQRNRHRARAAEPGREKAIRHRDHRQRMPPFPLSLYVALKWNRRKEDGSVLTWHRHSQGRTSRRVRGSSRRRAGGRRRSTRLVG